MSGYSLIEVPAIAEYREIYLQPDKVLTANDYQLALDVQSACNLSGIIYSFSRIMKSICEEDLLRDKGTKWKNQHPICILFATQIAFLTRSGSISDSYFLYDTAADICEIKAKK